MKGGGGRREVAESCADQHLCGRLLRALSFFGGGGGPSGDKLGQGMEHSYRPKSRGGPYEEQGAGRMLVWGVRGSRIEVGVCP